MPQSPPIITILKCAECLEPLHSRIIRHRGKSFGPNILRNRAELFCPLCDKTQNLLGAYKRQLTKKIE